MPVVKALELDEQNPEKAGAVETALDLLKEKNKNFAVGMYELSDKLLGLLPVVKPLLQGTSERQMAAWALYGEDLVTGEKLEGADRLKRSLKYTGKAMMHEAIAGLEVVGFVVPVGELPWAVRVAGLAAKGIKFAEAGHVVDAAKELFHGMGEKGITEDEKKAAKLWAEYFDLFADSPEARKLMIEGIEESSLWKSLTEKSTTKGELEIQDELINSWKDKVE